MGVFEFFKRKDVQYSFDFEYAKLSGNVYLKHLVLDTCASFIGRSLSSAEFRFKEDGKYVKNEIYRRLNLRPNLNQTASSFWQKFASKLIYDNEVLVVQSDTEDLLIADSFVHTKYALYEDTFSGVTVEDYTYERNFTQSQVMHIKFGNENLSCLIDGLYKDYGKLFSNVMSYQQRKNQLRATVNLDSITAKSPKELQKVDQFIQNIYKNFSEKDLAIVPQQPGMEYKEHFSGTGASTLTVDEIDKVTNGFFTQVARALGIPIQLLSGEVVNTEEANKNFLMYTMKPLLKKITDEINAKFITTEDYFKGDVASYYIQRYLDIFDVSNSIEKVLSSGILNINEIRSELGREELQGEFFNTYFITKNFSTAEEALKGGENTNNATT